MPVDIISSTYAKPHLNFRDQLELMKGRGLIVSDDAAAIDHLQRIGYYYLSGYSYPYRIIVSPQTSSTPAIRSNDFIPGTSFADILDLYVFDKKLRLLMLDAIERIELALRVDVSYQLGAQDTFAHYKSAFVQAHWRTPQSGRNGHSWIEDWCHTRDLMVKRSSDQFVHHVTTQYGKPLPIWIDVELWSLGDTSKFIERMLVQDKQIIMQKYDIKRPKMLQSWLRSICFVRNVSSHQGRLWNRNMVDYPMLPKPGELPVFDSVIVDAAPQRLYVTLCIIAHFMSVICPNSHWRHRLVSHIDSFPQSPTVSIHDMGISQHWRTHQFWV